jgi:hypothetical protein
VTWQDHLWHASSKNCTDALTSKVSFNKPRPHWIFAFNHLVFVTSWDLKGRTPIGPNLGTRPTEVRKPIHGGLEAASHQASHQTELGEKMQMSPNGPRPTCSGNNSGHLDLLVRSGSRAMPTKSPLRRGQRAT